MRKAGSGYAGRPRDETEVSGRDALARLLADETPDPDEDEEQAEAMPDPQPTLHQQRLAAVQEELKRAGAARVLDLGCGEGRLLKLLLDDPQFTEIVSVDVSVRALEIAADRLRLDRLSPARSERVRLLHGALTYRDRRLEGYDAAARAAAPLRSALSGRS